MSYALFEDEEKLTRSFPSRQDVWNAAERAGLVVPGPNGKMALEDHFEINRASLIRMKCPPIRIPTSALSDA
jgi:hypothetical protein